MSLRKKIAQLAWEKPDLRPHLLPLLKEAQKPTKVIFVEAVLDRPQDLVSWWTRQGISSLAGWDVKAHHMTLEFLGGRGSARDLIPYQDWIGKGVILKIKGYAVDDKGAAVLIDPGPLPVGNKYPHITVAVKGVSPVYSNQLLEQGPIHPATGSLSATVGYFDGNTRSDTFVLPPELLGQTF